MLQLTPLSHIFVSTCYVDFRKGISGLASFCKLKILAEPTSGSIFLFYNKSRTTIKILLYDGQGFILFIKRLSNGRFIADPTSDFTSRHPQSIQYNHCHKISDRILHVLINNGNHRNVKFAKDWKPLRCP